MGCGIACRRRRRPDDVTPGLTVRRFGHPTRRFLVPRRRTGRPPPRTPGPARPGAHTPTGNGSRSAGTARHVRFRIQQQHRQLVQQLRRTLQLLVRMLPRRRSSSRFRTSVNRASSSSASGRQRQVHRAAVLPRHRPVHQPALHQPVDGPARRRVRHAQELRHVRHLEPLARTRDQKQELHLRHGQLLVARLRSVRSSSSFTDEQKTWDAPMTCRMSSIFRSRPSLARFDYAC
jgi:hypothetical protein